jgi:hypothetical protein
MHGSDNKLIIMELAKEYGTSYDVIKEVIESPFAFMYETLKGLDGKTDELPDFYIPRLGRFKVRHKFKVKYENKEV